MALHIIGGTVVDVILPRVSRIPLWPEHTEFTSSNLTLLPDAPITTLGGNGGNAAYVAGRCGAKVILHTRIARDAMGQLARGWLTAAGCRVVTKGRVSATAVNVTAANQRLGRATFFYPGEPVELPGRLTACSHLLACGWPHPAPDKLAQQLASAHREGARTAIDIGPMLGRVPSLVAMTSVWAVLDVLLANEHELGRLTRGGDLATAVRRLRKRFAGHIVVKRGADGVSWWPEGESVAMEFAPPRVVAVNTVGAGDSFNGAWMAAWQASGDFATALRYANRAAATVVKSPQGVLGVRPPTLRAR
ncbi:carbohydrate kinase family protein [Synoicihabitans lomoniglobus]|uniref:Carbohydrate kinase family protein n=1 Tax=Synoicihabitans lomoniglobus TaxID=2909285 RepID=A0AAE9ZTU6_9BACT|nr:carbohydrate kinase family protein [Opitutaceae bacterium LMO-M01]WED65055.1 carbohydrate kinase family protein [Opitutaceae bacterium LMO-M01]